MGVDAEMFVRVRERWTHLKLSRLSGEMCAAFGHDRFFVKREAEHGFPPRKALTVIDVYQQDGDDIEPGPGETFIAVSLWTRYYGIGYERGDITLILGVADWLRRRTGGDVWYGGDSSGICAQPLTPEYREKLWAHFVEHGRAPYAESQNPFLKVNALPFCEFCQRSLAHYGGGGGGKEWARCHGCDLRMESVSGSAWQPIEVDQHGFPKKREPAT